MCGRLNITDSMGVRALCDQLDISLWPEDGMRFSRFIKATDRVSIIFEDTSGQRIMKNAIWWLLLDKQHTEQGVRFVPSRYTSFNTRYDKLNTPRSAGYHSYRQQRCVIPACGFGETQIVSGPAGNKKHYHDMQVAEDSQLALGGLYRIWQGVDATGQAFTEHSCSVVTLAPHSKLKNIHTKASPLMLSADDNSLQQWLNHNITEPDQLEHLLSPRLRHSLLAQPIDKPSSYTPVGPAFCLNAD